VLARRVISKNSGRQTFVQKLSHDKRIQPTILPVVETFLLNSFSERSAMAVRLQLPRKKAPNPVDKHVGRRVRMRRKMLAMSQEKLGAALGLTFQQVQKYENGTNRMGASRLQQMSDILQVPVEFFFEGAPNALEPHGSGSALSVAQIDDFISNSDGLRLIGAFMRIDNAAVRRRIVMLVQEIAGDDGN
jgi:transcriptional regulator with XRE-family HTH domain